METSFSSKIQKNWSKLQSRSPKEQSNFFSTEKQKNVATERIFSGLAAESWSGVVKNAIQMSSGASLAITFFAEMFCFQLFTYLGRKILPFLVAFFTSFPKSRLARSEKFLSWTYFLEKKLSVFILKVLGKINELLFLSFCRQSIAFGPNCNLQV